MPMHPGLQAHALAPLLDLLLNPGAEAAALQSLVQAGLLQPQQLAQWQAALQPPVHASDNRDLQAQAKLLADAQAQREGKLAPSNPLAVLAQLQPLLQQAQALGFWKGLQGAQVLDVGAGLFYPLSTAALLFANGAELACAFEPFEIHADFAAAALQALLVAVVDAPERFLLPGGHGDVRLLKTRLAGLDLAHLAERLRGGQADLGGVRLLRSLDAVPEAHFDLLFSNSVLEHVDPLPPALQRHLSLLKPGGIACHTVDFADHRYYFDRRLHPLQCLYDGVLDGINGLRPPQLEALFLAAGFQAYKHPKLRFPEGLIDPARARVPAFAPLPETVLQEWVNGYILRRPQ